ncbi:CDP-alcohol phosphatidyltransferase family protein [Pseudorhodobacter sp. W20_MBD10_FR17]|uniref:CDP-alcohol phosphatidyltransferase family protein n=1 Tax=Pseudorhodobacter sp. W20_MBD10_FR17 TaxID=3240266 RepID=UPI003F996EE3
MHNPASSHRIPSRLKSVLQAKSPLGAGVRMAALAVGLALPCAIIAEYLAPGRGFGGVALFTIVAAVAVMLMVRTYPHPRLGLCNAVTLVRAALASALAAPLLLAGAPDAGVAWAVTGFAALALALDGLDGWAARQSGLGSNYGARFDMEVDAALGLILALLVIDMGKVGSWVLLLGSMRYLFVIASFVLPWLTAPLPERFSRKLVCVVQIAVLIVLLVPPVMGTFAALLALGATLALAWSFAVDTVYLMQRRLI